MSIHWNAKEGNLKFLKEQLEAGAHINAKGPNGRSPLHIAIEYGQSDVVACLVRKGAYIEARDDLGRTPLHVAVLYGKVELEGLLRANNANPNARDDSGLTPDMLRS